MVDPSPPSPPSPFSPSSASSPSPACSPLPGLLDSLSAEAGAWLGQARQALGGAQAKRLSEFFPQLPRRLSRRPLGSGVVTLETGRIDLSAWRLCDGGALLLLQAAGIDAEGIGELYQHGDMEERTMVMRSLAARPVDRATIALLAEAQRSNVVPHFEAAVCDSNLLVRALEAEHPDFDLAGFNRLLLKLAFLDLSLLRVLGALDAANEELSRMVQDLASEREAAGRRVWRDTNRLIARAPTKGTLARIAGGLEHGDDHHRLAAAEGVLYLGSRQLLALARGRLEREPLARIRQALEAALRGIPWEPQQENSGP